MTASLAAPPAPVPPCPHLTGAFAPVAAEVDIADLPVTGRLPDGLDGAYLRNGSNPRFPPIGSYVHPLDGDGMLHRVTISGGRARYDNRFVRTPMVRAEEAAGRALWPGVTSRYRPGADLVGPILAGTLRERPSAGVVRHGGRLLALAGWTRPYRIGPALETLGPESFGGVLPAGIGGHPKIDPVTGQLLGFSCHTEPPFLTWTAVEPDGTARPPAPVEGLDRPTLIHDMAITRRFLVLVVAPLYLDVAAARRGVRLLAWRPEDGTRIALVPRDGGPVRWCDGTGEHAFWVWHVANARDGKSVADPAVDTVVLDHVEWERPPWLVPGVPARPRLARAVVDPAAGWVRREVLADLDVEFPRIDDRLLGADHRVAALAVATGRPHARPGCRDALAWYDTRTGAIEQWRPRDLAVGEPAHAPDPDAPGGGWWLTLATRPTTGESALLVIPAADPGSGPVATVHLPVRVPLGMHGTWLPAC